MFDPNNQGMLPASAPTQSQAPAPDGVMSPPVSDTTPPSPDGVVPPAPEVNSQEQQSIKQPPRDYKANPLNKNDEYNLNKFNYAATQIIHDPKIQKHLVSQLESSRKHPYEAIADLSFAVMERVNAEATKNKTEWDDTVKLMGGMSIVKQITEIASVIGKVKKNLSQKDFNVIFGEAVQKYYQHKIAAGEISKKQASQDAHMMAQLHAQMKGEDVSGVNKRIQATSDLQAQGVNANNSSLAAGTLATPQPAKNPMKPDTTMKEVLATGQGGLLNG